MSNDAILLLKAEHRQMECAVSSGSCRAERRGCEGQDRRQDRRKAERAQLHRERGDGHEVRILLPDQEDDVLGLRGHRQTSPALVAGWDAWVDEAFLPRLRPSTNSP